MVSSVSTKFNSLWKITKILKGQNKTRIPPLKNTNEILFKEKDKAEEIAKHLQSVHSLTGNMGIREHNEHINQTFKYNQLPA